MSSKVFKKENVLEEAINRIRFLFDEFENVVVGMSGGKDSTVVFNLAMMVAKEKNRLPLKVLWIDQEAEWQGTVDYMTKIMELKDVDPYWFQMPIVITNNANSKDRFSYCWEAGKDSEWIHNKHPLSKKENIYGTNRFHELFEKIFRVEFANKKSCYLSGVRTEESPKRFVALTQSLTYKFITYGKTLDKKNEHYTFYPIYDWSYRDIWKYIHDNNIEYNRVYDEMYRHGVGVNDMRISNVHHETALNALRLIQEIEPKTWNKVSKRINGANTIKHLGSNSYACPDELPYMFCDWKEYCLYLSENIISDPKNRNEFMKKFIKLNNIYDGKNINISLNKVLINTILSSDWDFTKIANFNMRRGLSYRRYKSGTYDKDILKDKVCFTDEELIIINNKLNEQRLN